MRCFIVKSGRKLREVQDTRDEKARRGRPVGAASAAHNIARRAIPLKRSHKSTDPINIHKKDPPA